MAENPKDNIIRMLYKAYSDLLGLVEDWLVKVHAETYLDRGTYHSLRNEIFRFRLWGDGVGAKSGTLDKALSDSKSLRSTLLYFLILFGTCLINLRDSKLHTLMFSLKNPADAHSTCRDSKFVV